MTQDNEKKGRFKDRTIYLIKEGLRYEKDILKLDKDLEKKTIQFNDIFGSLFFKVNEKKADWSLEYIDYGLEEPLPSVTSSGLLLLEVDGRYFAITHGRGRAFLRSGVYEEDFGLITSLNMIDSEQIKSVETTTLSSNPLRTHKQLSRPGRLYELSLDREDDLMKRIKGRSIERPDYISKVAGRDSLSLSVAITADNYRETLSDLLTFYQRDIPPEFEFVKHRRAIQNKALVVTLDNMLAVRAAKRDQVWLTPPELGDPRAEPRFSYSFNRDRVYNDLNLITFLRHQSRAPITIDVIKKGKIFEIDDHGQTIKEWSAYECLHGQVEKDGRLYVLISGKWFELDQNYFAGVDAFFQRAIRGEFASAEKPRFLHFPEFTRDNAWDPSAKKLKEGLYNDYVVRQDPDYQIADANLIQVDGYSKLEFCDLYHKNRIMVHVKREHGSASLSHLFTQTIGAGESFLFDKELRCKVNRKVLKSNKFRIADPNAEIDPRQYTIVFAIIQSPGNFDLPVLAKIGLRRAVKRLTQLGYQVLVQKIDDLSAGGSTALAS